MATTACGSSSPVGGARRGRSGATTASSSGIGSDGEAKKADHGWRPAPSTQRCRRGAGPLSPSWRSNSGNTRWSRRASSSARCCARGSWLSRYRASSSRLRPIGGRLPSMLATMPFPVRGNARCASSKESSRLTSGTGTPALAPTDSSSGKSYRSPLWAINGRPSTKSYKDRKASAGKGAEASSPSVSPVSSRVKSLSFRVGRTLVWNAPTSEPPDTSTAPISMISCSGGSERSALASRSKTTNSISDRIHISIPAPGPRRGSTLDEVGPERTVGACRDVTRVRRTSSRRRKDVESVMGAGVVSCWSCCLLLVLLAIGAASGCRRCSRLWCRPRSGRPIPLGWTRCRRPGRCSTAGAAPPSCRSHRRRRGRPRSLPWIHTSSTMAGLGQVGPGSFLVQRTSPVAVSTP